MTQGFSDSRDLLAEAKAEKAKVRANTNPNPDQIKARNEKLRSGRCLNGNFESPPCVHMNVKVHGWVFEVTKYVSK